MINFTLISTYFLRLLTAFVWNPTNIIVLEEAAPLHHHYSWNTQLCHRPIFQHCVSILMYFPSLFSSTTEVVPWLFSLLDRFAPYPHKYQAYLLPSFFSSPQHNLSVFFHLLTSYGKFNHSSVTSQDTSDRPFNSGFDFGRPTKHKGTNHRKGYT